jgi:hypothetical protein
MSWHLTILSIFIVGVSVFAISHWNDAAGWWLVVILLLGFTATYENGRPNFNGFAEELYKIGFPKP